MLEPYARPCPGGSRCRLAADPLQNDFFKETCHEEVWTAKFSMTRIAVGVLPAVVAFTPISATPADQVAFQVHPGTFDPANTDLVGSLWVKGAGCPSNAAVATYPATTPTGPPFTDPACLTGDTNDKDVEGLLLVKTGPTSNNAAAVATIIGLPKNLVLTELGYDLRKPASPTDPRGSHCGAGAPRFNITTTVDSYFLGCNSPPPTVPATSDAWIRLRWGSPLPLMAYNSMFALAQVQGTVKSIEIVFDEGQDTPRTISGPPFWTISTSMALWSGKDRKPTNIDREDGLRCERRVFSKRSRRAPRVSCSWRPRTEPNCLRA